MYFFGAWLRQVFLNVAWKLGIVDDLFLIAVDAIYNHDFNGRHALKEALIHLSLS